MGREFPNMNVRCLLLFLVFLLPVVTVRAQSDIARVEVVFSERLGPMNLDKMALGQGGLSEKPMWDNRAAEVRALKPKVIRLFIQEYFDLLPEPGHCHFDTLDRSVDTIHETGATPLMNICFKPRALFPAINQDIVEPADYAPWETLIFNLVRRYKDRGPAIRYWEVANEPDIGEDGGCPYRFKPESYARYYQHTAAAILRADPDARVGGPALASVHSPIFPALLEAAATQAIPLHFVSWHIYSSDPKSVRATVDYAMALLKQYPAVKVETFLDEWNMDLTNPPLDPRFQPCYVAETIWQMKDAGLDFSCYYHIKDYYVDNERFKPFMSPRGVAFMARWWDRMPQFDGLFDYQNNARPAYFTFKLLSRFGGDRLRVTSSHPAIHGFASRDESMLMENLMLWNFSDQTVRASISFQGLTDRRRTRHLTLDARSASPDENARLRPDPYVEYEPGDAPWQIEIEPYGIHYWSLE